MQNFGAQCGKYPAPGGKILPGAGYFLSRLEDWDLSRRLRVSHPDYYSRFGYQAAETLVSRRIEFMACELAEGGLKGVRGRVEFAPAGGRNRPAERAFSGVPGCPKRKLETNKALTDNLPPVYYNDKIL